MLALLLLPPPQEPVVENSQAATLGLYSSSHSWYQERAPASNSRKRSPGGVSHHSKGQRHPLKNRNTHFEFKSYQFQATSAMQDLFIKSEQRQGILFKFTTHLRSTHRVADSFPWQRRNTRIPKKQQTSQFHKSHATHHLAYEKASVYSEI